MNDNEKLDTGKKSFGGNMSNLGGIKSISLILSRFRSTINRNPDDIWISVIRYQKISILIQPQHFEHSPNWHIVAYALFHNNHLCFYHIYLDFLTF